MSILDKKLKRDLFQSKGMLGAIVAVVAVGIGCLVGFQGTYRNLDSAKNDYYAQCRLADFWMDLKKVPLAQVEELGDIPGISELRHRIVFPVIINLDGVERPISGRIMTLPDHPQPILNNIVLRRGDYFTDERRDEVIVNEGFAQARHIRVGDDIHLIMNRRLKTMHVVGTAISAEAVYLTPPGGMTPDSENWGLFYVKRSDAAEVLDFKGAANSVVGLLTPEARKDPKPVLDELERRFKVYGVFGVTPLSLQSSNLALSSELEGLSIMAAFMPAIFLSVAALILNVLMTRMAEQQRTVVGTLKALGYGRWEILSHFLKIGLIVGFIGTALGAVLGYLVSLGLTSMYTQFFTFPRLRTLVYPGLMGLSLVVAQASSVLGTIKGVRAVSRLKPAEAMRPAPPAVAGKVLIERIGLIWRHLGFRWQMVLRSLFRNKPRTLANIFAAAMGAALLVFTFGSVDSIYYMVDFQFDQVLLSDYDLSFREELEYDAVFEIEKLPGVERVEPILTVPCTFYNGHRNKKGAIQGILPEATMTVPRDENGQRVTLSENGLLMTRRLADELGLAPGDRVRVVPTKGAQQPFQVWVADVVDSMVGLAVYADYHFLNGLIDEENAVSQVQLKARQSPEEHARFLAEIKRYPTLQNYGDVKQQRETMYQTFVRNMSSMIFPMVVFGGVIFLGAILNSSLIGLIERQREIATFRVLGYQSGEVGRIFFRENLVQNLLGTLLGLPLGWLMLKGLAVSFANDLYAMPCIIRNRSWFLTLLLAFIFVLGSQFVIQRAINRMNWGDALKMKE